MASEKTAIARRDVCRWTRIGINPFHPEKRSKWASPDSMTIARQIMKPPVRPIYPNNPMKLSMLLSFVITNTYLPDFGSDKHVFFQSYFKTSLHLCHFIFLRSDVVVRDVHRLQMRFHCIDHHQWAANEIMQVLKIGR